MLNSEDYSQIVANICAIGEYVIIENFFPLIIVSSDSIKIESIFFPYCNLKRMRMLLW